MLIQLANFSKFFTFISVNMKLTRRMTAYKIDLFLILSQKSSINFSFNATLSKKFIINLSLKNFDSTCYFFQVFHIYFCKYEVNEKNASIQNWLDFSIQQKRFYWFFFLNWYLKQKNRSPTHLWKILIQLANFSSFLHLSR